MGLEVSDVRPFLPSKNFLQSFDFYRQMGWTVNWKADDDSMALLELGNNRFFLQNYYNKEWAENCMLYIVVEDANAWWEHTNKVIAEGAFDSARTTAPKKEPHGALVTYVWDPCGVLLHFAQPLSE